MALFSRSINIIAILLLSLSAFAQPYPRNAGDKAKHEFVIEMPKAYVSGILIMARVDENTVNASIVNEFGISLMDFIYNEKKDKVKLYSVMKKLDKWYIKRTLRSDLKQVMKAMQAGNTEYYDKKHKIKYTFYLIDDTEG